MKQLFFIFLLITSSTEVSAQADIGKGSIDTLKFKCNIYSYNIYRDTVKEGLVSARVWLTNSIYDRNESLHILYKPDTKDLIVVTSDDDEDKLEKALKNKTGYYIVTIFRHLNKKGEATDFLELRMGTVVNDQLTHNRIIAERGVALLNTIVFYPYYYNHILERAGIDIEVRKED